MEFSSSHVSAQDDCTLQHTNRSRRVSLRVVPNSQCLDRRLNVIMYSVTVSPYFWYLHSNLNRSVIVRGLVEKLPLRTASVGKGLVFWTREKWSHGAASSYLLRPLSVVPLHSLPHQFDLPTGTAPLYLYMSLLTRTSLAGDCGTHSVAAFFWIVGKPTYASVLLTYLHAPKATPYCRHFQNYYLAQSNGRSRVMSIRWNIDWDILLRRIQMGEDGRSCVRQNVHWHIFLWQRIQMGRLVTPGDMPSFACKMEWICL